MAIQSYASPQASRQSFVNGELLAHVIPQEIIGRVCHSQKKTIPQNSTDTIKFRRYLPKGATTTAPNTWSVDPAAHVLSEGETPNAETVTAQDITAQLEQYGVLYRYTDKTADLHEDDIPSEMARLVGERGGLLLEMIRYGVLKACTNVYRAGSVSTRATIVDLVDANVLMNIARGLFNNLSMKVTDILSASVNVDTHPVEAAYVVVCSGDLDADIRTQLAAVGDGFVHVSKYGSRKPMHENELGSWQQFRFVTSPHMAPYLLAGGATAAANTRLANGVANTAGTEACDVYPMIVMTERAYGDVALRGRNAIQAYHRKPGGSNGMESASDDPLGQRGHVGFKTYFTAVILNQLQMAVLEVACSSLTS